MSLSICETCGTQYAQTPAPAVRCPVCEDERIGWDRNAWTTPEALRTRHKLRVEDNDGLLGIGLDPGFAINQRALYLPTDAGNLLWECLSLVTDEAVAALGARGGVDLIVISHPHFYASMLDWSEALGGIPIMLHEADRAWVQRHSPRIRFWSGDEYKLSAAVTLIRSGGHFPGNTVLHWRDGPRAGGALFSGDSPQVVGDRRHVSFMYSFPRSLPMKPRDVQDMRSRFDGYEFEDVFGYTWDRNIIGGARTAVDASFDRYLEAVSDS